MTNTETIKAIDAEIKRQEADLQRLREELAAIVQEDRPTTDDQRLMDAVLHCPHSLTHESVTLHFYPRQKEGHNALAQLHHRLAAYNLAARQREMQLLGEIEALERLALNVLKQLGGEATPIAWYVTGCSTMLDEHDAKAEAKRCGGSAKAVPLYTVPRGHAATQPAAQGVELANCKGDKWLTVVYRDIQPGDESRTIVEHPKVSALSWSHALHDRDAALAAQAKQG